MKEVYEIKETVLNDDLLLKLSNKMRLMPNDYLKACIGERIILSSTSTGEILAVAFIDNISAKKFENYHNYMPPLDFIDIRDDIIPTIIQGGIWLGVLETLVEGAGYGTEIVNLLKKQYSSIILFADGGADYYWKKQNFKCIGTGMFLWSDKSDKKENNK